jgi:hypothetical protein
VRATSADFVYEIYIAREYRHPHNFDCSCSPWYFEDSRQVNFESAANTVNEQRAVTVIKNIKNKDFKN